jgi:lipopolysaccharide/colanic/teichoic acid biosynthesis glycosyltransferase
MRPSFAPGKRERQPGIAESVASRRSPKHARRLRHKHGRPPGLARLPVRVASAEGLHERRSATAKRLLDVLVALLLLVILAPMWLVVIVLIKLNSRGPVFFRQRRLGRNMQPFTMLKFRTMRSDSTPELHRRYIAELVSDGRTANGTGLNKLTADPRVTRVGGVLRKLSVDELPQLLNVLIGQMSLVGPRPALEYELDHYAQHHFARFDVLPGMTGHWQVSGRNRLGFEEMLELDAEYAENHGFLTDLRILARTPRAAIGRTA